MGKAAAFTRNVVAQIYDEPQTVKLADLTAHDEIQVRVAGLKESHVEGMVASLEAGRELPPITVYKLVAEPHPQPPMRPTGSASPAFAVNGEGSLNTANAPYVGLMVVADGFHRYEAHKRLGRDTILARVVEGTLLQALAAAEQSNLDNAANLTMEDKFSIFRNKWLRNDELDTNRYWRTISGRERARFMRISPDTESRWLARLSDDLQSEAAAARVIGADGRTYNTDKIREANERRKAEAAQQRLKTKIALAVRNDKLGAWEADNIRIEECSDSPTDLWLIVHYPNGAQKINGAYSRPADKVYEHNKAVEAAERSIVEEETPPPTPPRTRGGELTRQPGGAHPQLDGYTVALYNRLSTLARDSKLLFDQIREARSIESLYMMNVPSLERLQQDLEEVLVDFGQIDIYAEMVQAWVDVLGEHIEKAKEGVM